MKEGEEKEALDRLLGRRPEAVSGVSVGHPAVIRVAEALAGPESAKGLNVPKEGRVRARKGEGRSLTEALTVAKQVWRSSKREQCARARQELGERERRIWGVFGL